jgi:RNA-directed DNA polymerase
MDHDRLLEMLEQRINDRAFLGLIRKWLKAGMLETDGKVIHPETGTPKVVSSLRSGQTSIYTMRSTSGLIG